MAFVPQFGSRHYIPRQQLHQLSAYKPEFELPIDTKSLHYEMEHTFNKQLVHTYWANPLTKI